MHKSLGLFLLFILLAAGLAAQEEGNGAKEVDSLTTNLQKEGIEVGKIMVAKRKEINPLAPSKAAFYSAIFPGLGQIYNKRYWKVPIVYGAIGTGVYVYSFNNDQYLRFRKAFKSRQAGFTNDEFYDLNGSGIVPGSPDFSDAALERAQQRYQRDRDLALLVTIALYAANVIDANVDSHLKQFNVDPDLSIQFKPFLNLDPINANPYYGMALTIRF